MTRDGVGRWRVEFLRNVCCQIVSSEKGRQREQKAVCRGLSSHTNCLIASALPVIGGGDRPVGRSPFQSHIRSPSCVAIV